MSAETKQQELWSMPEGARCPSQMQNTRKHENRGEAEPECERYSPGGEGRREVATGVFGERA